MASSILNKLKDSYSVSLNITNYVDAQELKTLLDQTAQRVRNSRSASINQTIATVYETNYPNKEYFGIGYDAVDYQRSSEYQKFAEEAGYIVAIVKMPLIDLETAMARNKHNVPEESLKSMIERWQE